MVGDVELIFDCWYELVVVCCLFDNDVFEVGLWDNVSCEVSLIVVEGYGCCSIWDGKVFVCVEYFEFELGIWYGVLCFL